MAFISHEPIFTILQKEKKFAFVTIQIPSCGNFMIETKVDLSLFKFSIGMFVAKNPGMLEEFELSTVDKV